MPHTHLVQRAAQLITQMYTSVMQPVMRPSEAYARMAHKRVKRVPIDDLEGCITAVLLTPYPPGIPLLIPGEMVNATIVAYLRAMRSFNEEFPGFQTEIHGLVEEPNNRGTMDYFLDCVAD